MSDNPTLSLAELLERGELSEAERTAPIFDFGLALDLEKGKCGVFGEGVDPEPIIEYHLKNHPRREEILAELRASRPELFPARRGK